MFKLTAFLAVAALSLTLPALSRADDEAGEHHHHGPHGRPPDVALKACEGKKAGDSCSFAAPWKEGKTINGTCFSPKEDLPLACRPEHHKGGQSRHGHGQGQGRERQGRG